jgi:hypothetical protein
MTFDPFTNRVPFGLLTDEEKAALQSEGPWDYFAGANWWKAEPNWMDGIVYRRAKPSVIMPTVDWSCFGPAVKAVAADKDGRVFAYTSTDAKASENVWHHGGSFLEIGWAFPPHAYTRGTCDWKDSLVLRPKETTE